MKSNTNSVLELARYRGLVAAPFTPFNEDLSPNLDAVEAYADLLRNNGIQAAFVCGTTGEGLSMPVDERMAVTERWVECANGDFRVIAHVGHCSVYDACDLASHAAGCGVDAISTMAPCFFKPATVFDLVEWCEKVAVAGGELPFYYYHIPSMSGVHLPMIEFLQEAGSRIPNLAGIKYTYEDLSDFQKCVSFEDGKYDILFGRDELLLEGIKAGAIGAVGSTYNYAAPLYADLISSFQNGNETNARCLQDRALKMINLCNSVGVSHLAATKALMSTLGVDCGPVRPPLGNPSFEQKETLFAALEQIGFSEFCCNGRKQENLPPLP